jgi:hypothetical protein
MFASDEFHLAQRYAKEALSAIREAGEVFAINYGCPDTAREALNSLVVEGYTFVRDALTVLDGTEHAGAIDAAFWKGYSDGSR